MKTLKVILSAAALLLSSMSFAEILVYEFKDPQLELRFNHLTEELRCPKCQNNNLADSNAPLAEDLKNIIVEKLNANETDEQIISYLKERYGDFITYRPPVKPSTWIIWFGPFIFLLGGAWVIFRFVAGRKESTSHQQSSVVSQSSEQLLAEWQSELNQPEKPIKNDSN